MDTRISWASPALVVVCCLLTVSCTTRGSLHPADVAQTSFSRDHYCPLERVRTAMIENVPPAPSAIAQDPARQAMWSEAHRGTPSQSVGGEGATPFIVRATGCEEASLYVCRVEGGRVPARRGTRYEQMFTICTERR